MLEIEIDGQSLAVEDGSTIMDAASKVGTYIPHFCYHKKLSIAANCRMCLVQVEKAPKPLPACATPVTDGMKIWTCSEMAVKAQKGVMEFLLINHPLDCPICDQGGECQLQDLAVGYGAGQSRYQEEKRVVLEKYLGPLVATEMTRCINCTRCVRFTQEIAGEMELGQAFRGEHAEIMPFIEKTVDTELSGNIIDLCPVGALTSKPFRFAARTWELSRRKSISPHDALGSNLIVQVMHNQVKRVLPLENESLNECWLSDKDRFSYEGLNSSERLSRPMLREQGEWREVDWATALGFVAAELKKTLAGDGTDAIAALASPHATVEELYLLQKLVRGLGSDNVDFRLRQTDFRADASRLGAPWLGMKVAEIASLEHLLVIGSFFRKDAPLVAQRVRQANKRGLKVSAIHALKADWHLPLQHECVVAPLAMEQKLVQLLFAVAAEKSLTPPAAFIAHQPGVIDDDMRRLAADLVRSGDKNAVWLGSAAVYADNASQLEALAAEIAKMLGGRFGFIGEAANSVGGYLAQAVPSQAGGNAADLIARPRQNYLLLNTEPGFDFADAAQSIHALEQARMVVALTSFDSDILRQCANVLLPIAPFTETSGTFINAEGRAQSFTAVAQALGETRPGWKVLRVLGNLLDVEGFGFNDSTEIYREALPEADFETRLYHQPPGFDPPATSVPTAQNLQRIAEVPIHFADMLVRRAKALQKTKDAAAPVVELHGTTLQSLGLTVGKSVTLKQGDACVQLVLRQNDDIAPGGVRVAAAHLSTIGLGPMSGRIEVLPL